MTHADDVSPPEVPVTDARQLAGRWRLVSWTAVRDDGHVGHPFGASESVQARAFATYLA